MLALALGGRTVKEWQAVMTQVEFEQWVAFYNQQPFDDLHRYHRPAALIARSMWGGDVDKMLDWLAPPVENDEYSAADLATLKAFGVKPPRKG